MNDLKIENFMSGQGKLLINKKPQEGEPDGNLMLIVHHQIQEDIVALGINRRSTTMTFPMLLEMQGVYPPATRKDEFANLPVYLGGPANDGGIYLIHTQDYSDQSTRHVYGNVYISSSPKTFQNFVTKSPPQKWLVVFGEIFFNPNAMELLEKDPEWQVVDHDEDMIFEGTGEEEWIGYRWSDVKWHRAAKKTGILK